MTAAPFVHLTDLVGSPGVVEDALGRRRLAVSIWAMIPMLRTRARGTSRISGPPFPLMSFFCCDCHDDRAFLFSPGAAGRTRPDWTLLTPGRSVASGARIPAVTSRGRRRGPGRTWPGGLGAVHGTHHR